MNKPDFSWIDLAVKIYKFRHTDNLSDYTIACIYISVSDKDFEDKCKYIRKFATEEEKRNLIKWWT